MILPFIVAHTATNSLPISQYQQIIVTPLPLVPLLETAPVVPFYSQFKDIQSPTWQKVGCGVTSLAMVIGFYNPNVVTVNTLLKEGIASGAYLQSAGWTYAGLIGLSEKYGLEGNSYDLGKSNSAAAFDELKTYLKDGPVIASVHYKFDPKSTIPHLVVINGLDNGMVNSNDPAAKSGNREISVADFLKAWKKRFIVIRPAKESISFLGNSTFQAL